MRDKYQSIIITLSDGSKHIFTGKACCDVGDSRRIIDTKFTIPKELPEGHYFDDWKVKE